MKIAVYGATGQAGTQIVDEAVRRGHEVIALSRHEPSTALPEGARWQQADAADPAGVGAAVAGADAVVTAHGPSRVPGEDPNTYASALPQLVAALGGTRVLVIGGAGSLLTATGERLVDTPGFPDEYKPEALSAAVALESLRATDASTDWTYLSPAPVLAPGERTGGYRSGTDNPVGDSISFADLAIAVLDELETPKHRRERFTVASA